MPQKKWQCTKCGKTATGTISRPSDTAGGKCPSTATGNHMWKDVS